MRIFPVDKKQLLNYLLLLNLLAPDKLCGINMEIVLITFENSSDKDCAKIL